MSLQIVPLSFADACAFVTAWHRHHEPPVGHKFSLGVALDQVLVGVAIVGRPVARSFDDGRTLEVTRVATDGTPHAASMLYAAAWRASKALGFRRLVTYTQRGESGASLRAAGWSVIAERPPRPGWNMPSRPRETKGTENVQRYLWEQSTAGARCAAPANCSPSSTPARTEPSPPEKPHDQPAQARPPTTAMGPLRAQGLPPRARHLPPRLREADRPLTARAQPPLPG